MPFRVQPGVGLRAAAVAVLLLATPRPALAQPSDLKRPDRPSAPTAGVLFDDFRYTRPVAYSLAAKSGPDDTIFGPNRWLTGPDLDHLSVGAGRTRAWYGYGWQDEYIDYAGLPCGPEDICADESLYDGAGAELYTEPASASPGHAVMRYRAGSYRGRLVNLLLTSGFAARTGTWVARVKLPAFDGLDRGNGGLGVLLAPLWLKNPTEAWETRSMWPGNTSGTNWWEANIEFWREQNVWKPYADIDYDPGPIEGEPRAAEPLRTLSAGNSWYPYSDAVYRGTGGRVHSQNATFGPCTVVYRSETPPYAPQTSTRSQADCLDATTGRSARGELRGIGHPYAYVVMQNTGRETRRFIYARREDEHGAPTPSSGFESLLMEQRQTNYVDPGFFSAQLEMILYPAGSVPMGTIEGQDIDMRFDWFLYTPDATLDVQETPDIARTIQQRLGRHNAAVPADEQVWRVNTTRLALGAPMRPIDPWATCNRYRIEPVEDWDFAVEKTDRGGGTYFTVQLRRSAGRDLRSMYQSVVWRVERNGQVVDDVRNQGYTLQRDAHWGSDGPFDVTATVTQTSPVTSPPWEWSANHSPDRPCPENDPSRSTRTHTYRYDPARGLYEARP